MSMSVTDNAGNFAVNGFSIWNLVQNPAYCTPNNPVNLLCGVYISGTNHNLLQLTIVITWNFQVQNSRTNSGVSTQTQTQVAGRQVGGQDVPFSDGLGKFMTIPTLFTPVPVPAILPIDGDKTTLTGSFSGYYYYGPFGQHTPLSFGPYSCTIYLFPQWVPPPGLQWNPPWHPPFYR